MIARAHGQRLRVRRYTRLDHRVDGAERANVIALLPPVPARAFAAEPAAGDRKDVGRRVRLAFGFSDETIEDPCKSIRHFMDRARSRIADRRFARWDDRGNPSEF